MGDKVKAANGGTSYAWFVSGAPGLEGESEWRMVILIINLIIIIVFMVIIIIIIIIIIVGLHICVRPSSKLTRVRLS